MAVGVIMEFDGGTIEQYDEVIRRMGLEPGGDTPDGALFHWCAATPAGIRVTDVWESAEQFERFAGEEIGPHTAAVGVPGPPRTQVVPVHGYLTAGEGTTGGDDTVAVIVEFDGATLDQYDTAIREVGLRSGGPASPGCLFHWVQATDGGIRVTDVWSSRAAFEAYAASHIMPATAAAGFSDAPRVEYLPVHSYFTA